ncbi:MAG: GTP cyclohydrolase I [Holosporaceae bacterium]|jgi:GTP cyclohydrolase I|nr:GTP cyclohydrolase I [Holosporaceae bacterium]
MEDHIRAILEEIDPHSDQMDKTPGRVSAFCKDFFSGYGTDPNHIAGAFYDSEMNDLIILKDIAFESVCEHHLAPIIGTASVGYVPNGKIIIGASKLARIVDCFAHRLQLQERMTIGIGRAVDSILQAKGVGVYVEAEHFCISNRGVKKRGARFVTRYFSGVLQGSLRQEFLATVLSR